MIAPQELRIGNFIKTLEGVFEIKAINIHSAVLNGGIITTYPSLEPIELTEDWLLKFGFKPAEFHDFLYKNIFIINYGGKYYRAYLDGKTKIDVELKYVHQLQNLYHSLCGEELKINEI